MNSRRQEIRQLAEMLEAEFHGRPFDRKAGHHLAARLAEYHPDMRSSMRLICERFAATEGGHA